MYVGNAGEDAALDRGWLLGHFKDADDPRHSEALEIVAHHAGLWYPAG